MGLRSEPLAHIDYLVMGEHAERKLPPDARFREESRAVNLGNAAGHAHYGDVLTGTIRDAQAEHDGLESRLEAAEPRRHGAEQLHALQASRVAALAAVPLSAVDPIRKHLNGVAKLLLITGDTSVIADQVFRASTPMVLALLLGVSLATSVVAIGAKCGHEMAAADQRKDRGSAPPDAQPVVTPFYDNGTAEDQQRVWRTLSAVAAGTMFLALFLIGRGSGDPAELALGYGMLGALTVAGSAAAEAYATNDVAEQLTAAERRLGKRADQLVAFEDAEDRSAERASFASTTERAARHGAVATAATVTATANRLPETPEVGGYVDPGHVPTTPEPRAPAPDEPNRPAASPRRTKTRPRYELIGNFTSSVSQSDGDRPAGVRAPARPTAPPPTSPPTRVGERASSVDPSCNGAGTPR